MTFEHSRKQQNVGYTDATIGCSLKQPKREVLTAEGLAWNCATTNCENVIKINITH